MSALDWGNLGDTTNVVRTAGLLIPLLTAVLTKRFAGSRLKSIVTVALTALTSVVASFAGDADGRGWNEFAAAFFNTFVAGIAAYYGFYKPAGITDGIARSTSKFGLGSNPDGHRVGPLDSHGDSGSTART